MQKKICILLLLFSFRIISGFSQIAIEPTSVSSVQNASSHYRFMKLDATNGLSNNQVICFLKDSKGYLWFGTISGLNRFDGHTIKVFRHQIRDSTSLLNSHIIKLFEDPLGKIWVTTIEGVCIYDPDKENFIRNTRQYAAQFSLPDGAVRDIVKDRKGNYWFIHTTTGLYVYQVKEAKKVSHLDLSSSPDKSLSPKATLPPNQQISSFVEDKQGRIWIVYKSGVLCQLDPISYRILYQNTSLRDNYNAHALQNGQNFNLIADRDGDLWLYVLRANLGAFYFNTKSRTFLKADKDSPHIRLKSNIIQGIVEDNQGLIWIGTDHGGINLVNKQNWQMSYLLHDPDNSKSLSQNTINSLYKDQTGIIWAGTYKDGVNYYHENIFRFPLYQTNRSMPKGLPYNDFNRFVEDEKGNLWMGANGGGLIYFDRNLNSYTSYHSGPGSIGSNVVVSLLIDKEKKLWIGTYYGGLSCFDGKKSITYRHQATDKNSISDDSIWELFEDSKGQIWIGTLDGGLERLDPKTGKFTHYASGAPHSIHASYVSEIVEDRHGFIWVGTSYGLEKYDYTTNRFTHYLSNAQNTTALSNNLIHALYKDSRGLLWVGTHEGLCVLDEYTNSFRVFRKEEGLAHNTILSLVEDKAGNLWFGTPAGITCAHIVKTGAKGNANSTKDLTLTFANYDESDGLQGKEFNENAALRTRSGELLFGGARGYNQFYPKQIVTSTQAPEVVLSDFYLFNKKVGIGETFDSGIILPLPLDKTKEITLDHSQNVFAIEFAAMDFFHPGKNRYRYKLEGFDRQWTYADLSRKVTYTNLNAGSYVFKVQACNEVGEWASGATQLTITVLPPLWLTKTALCIYGILFLLLLYLSKRLVEQRQRIRFEYEQQRKEALRMHELDQLKIQFFTNVSHEFRTPLTLILSPLERLLQHSTDPHPFEVSGLHNQLRLIDRNAKRLLNLVNQLLDLRKIELEKIKLAPNRGEVIGFIRDTTLAFSDLSEKKRLSLSFHSEVQELYMDYDADKLEKILFNLLSNAFKFTPEGGIVSVYTSIYYEDSVPCLQIDVKDSGIGISPGMEEKIFDRFVQNEIPASMINQGSGIGLSITKEFVNLHGGKISVQSRPQQGSCFTVYLPITRESKTVQHDNLPKEISKKGTVTFEDRQLLSTPVFKNKSVPDQKMPPETVPNATIHCENTTSEDKATILLVEDHEEFREYLKGCLLEKYHIVEAKNGKDGWQKILLNLPDLIISDIMMPEMNGLELCRQVKSDVKTSHIPILLLTARSEEEQQLEGYQTGAQDYTEKPFHFGILESKIKSLLSQQQAARNAFTQQIRIQGKDIPITPLDEKLIRKAIGIVEKNMSNPDFSVETLSLELGMSRIHLYRKLQALTEKSPLDFIRVIRLERSRQLLEESQLTIAEIAYQVGFNNPKYFAKYFRQHFGELPSAYLTRKRSLVNG
ncbi:two-component regulator propeller domain-containing protein [Cytophagaceae bacterium DM2B3-1]|uniref:histidine kinase n=1 Tax=Xanthocytophaga flava TaxID=3048013 RepID=A0ABT7CH34_9BACT|nr:two-component regulator propeller domain-containing protein [Xanthocytophaga flavus]MDJ1492998.1 two-component regulator propeller domain-containing protein [Xanthocytophaga flavus]